MPYTYPLFFLVIELIREGQFWISWNNSFSFAIQNTNYDFVWWLNALDAQEPSLLSKESLPIFKTFFLKKGKHGVPHFHTLCIHLDEWLIVGAKIMGRISLFYTQLKWATIQLWSFCMLRVHVSTISIQKYNSLLKRFESL